MKVQTVISLKYMELNTTFSYCVFVFGKAKKPQQKHPQNSSKLKVLKII